MNDGSIIIKTDFKDSDEVVKDLIDSVFGQLSDGMWENSRRMEKYWKGADRTIVDGMVAFKITDPWILGGSAYQSMGERALIWNSMFARWLKAVVKAELKDYPALGKWARDNKSTLEYLSRGPGRPTITVQDAYRVYDSLLGRKERIPSGANPEKAASIIDAAGKAEFSGPAK